MLEAVGFDDPDAGSLGEQVRGLEIRLFDGIRLIRAQGIDPRLSVSDVERFDLVEVWPAFLEIVRIALRRGAKSRTPFGEHEGTGSDALVPCRAFGAGNADNEVVVGHQEGESRRCPPAA